MGREKGGSYTFTCKGYRELAELRDMLVGMKRMARGHCLEEKGGETGDREVGLEEPEKGKGFLAPDNRLTEEYRNGNEKAGRTSSEDSDTVIEIDGEHGTEWEETGMQLMDGKGIRTGTQMLSTRGYKKNPNRAVGNELDLYEGDTLGYLMKHNDNENWWL